MKPFTNIYLAVLVFIVAFCPLLVSCSPNYLYSTINAEAFAIESPLNAPTAPEQQLTPETIFSSKNIEVIGNIIIISPSELTNYIVSNLHDYIFIINADAIISFNNVFHTRFASLIICPSSTLYLNINTNIFCGQDEYDLKEYNLPTDCSVFVNNLFIFGNGSINNTMFPCIKSTNLTTNCNSLSLYSNTTAIDAGSASLFGTLNFYSQIGIKSNNITINSRNLTFECKDVGILCDNLIIENGTLNINAPEGIFCKAFIKKSGYLTLFCNVGIICQSIKLIAGYLYASCKSTCIKICHEFVQDGGIALLVSEHENTSAIDAETADFIVVGGILLTNSTYACAPKQNAWFFAVDKNDLFTCKSSTSQLAYIPQVSGSLMIASTAQYNYFSTNGKLIDFKNNFYGLLINATVYTYSSKSINNAQPNYGAIIYNERVSKNGQIL